MIPIFPNFKLLSLSDKKEIEKITSEFEPYSDYNFMSLWSYNVDDDILISLLNNNLVIKFKDYTTSESFYSFIGSNEIVSTTHQLLKHSEGKNKPSELKLIPESVANGKTTLISHFTVHEDRDNFDYILSVDELAEFRGGKYQKHRKFLNRFRSSFPNLKSVKLDLTDPLIQQQIINLFFSWASKKGKNEDEIKHELTAMKRILKDAASLDLFSLGISDKGKLIAFVIADTSNSEHAQTHFVKSDNSYEGIYQALRHDLANYLKKLGHSYINIEQDLGIPGLRFAKEQWNPVKYLKKYTISRKT